MSEHAVIINFKYGTTDLSALFDAEDKLTEVIEKAQAGELDGHEVAVDGSDGVFYMYGPDADVLFKAIEPTLKEISFMQGAEITKRYGEPDDDTKEDVITLQA